MESPPSDHFNHMSGLDSPASVTSSTSSSSSPDPTPPSPSFTKFAELPAELRHQIWRAALPEPGVNFFNVHCIPNDHLGANRSNSPPWLYLDLRRLSIFDDDATVAEYDPSAWQAREVLRRVCHEAQQVCAPRPDESATITLTRPRRGLFVTAGGLEIRHMTPYTKDRATKHSEPLVYRKIQVRTDDILCLSVENCSFNLPFEEMPVSLGGGSSRAEGGIMVTTDPDETLDDMGWTYDPQITPFLPASLSFSKICVNLARGSRLAFDYAGSVLMDMIAVCQNLEETGTGDDTFDRLPLIMLDAYKQELGQRSITELTPRDEVYWDRFGDRYILLPMTSADQLADYRLTKIWPETNDIRERYLRSALLQSSKRPVPSLLE
ncbi:uncharacterized protein F4822DRAFT_52128 [Hypoxylon trugodes]|uniref:uncharacterized protein n=1 Tax=Hypoxylon trugodes TaxID=326681 RepID=UPI0021A20D83|nr:uncharacterized protein F4822DRAFT_52128 [Hypoxylon trugodes]KAI1383809.1 hypothetical protein F4822DRAFT_52128 [Hypoxylon trugodes]